MSDVMTCSICGQLHSADEIELTFRRPDAIALLSESDRIQSCRETEDRCAIWGAGESPHRYFVRGLLPVKVVTRSTIYNIGVWIEVSKVDFDSIYELWDDANQSTVPPFHGMLANDIPTRRNSLGLAGYIQLTGPETRPNFMVSDTKTALFSDQQFGVTEHEAAEYTRQFVR